MGVRIVPERFDERVPLQRLLHDAALNALAAAVHEPQLAQPFRMRRVHVLLDDGRDVAGEEGVQVELRPDGDARVVIHIVRAAPSVAEYLSIHQENTMRRTRARGFALTTAAATLVSVSALAQGQSGQTGSVGDGIIAGRVVDAVTGRPVAGATVTLGWVSAEAAASSTPVVPTRVRPGSARPGVQVTDDTGRFEYAGLTAGRFRLQVRGGPGYRWSYFGMQTPWDTATGSTQHELRSNERLTDVVLKLWPGGSISGTVRDEFGEPVVKASLRLFERQTGPAVSGWRRTTVSAETDDCGQYRLGDWPLTGFVGTGPSTLAGPGPGDYIIVVTAPRSSPGTVPAFAGAVFAPGTRSIAGAQIISLGVGEHRSGNDIVVSTKGGSGWSSVRGRILNSGVLREPLPLRLVPAEASNELANFLEITTTAGVDGQFAFPPVPAGEYRLKVWQFPEGVGGGRPPLKGPDPTTWMADLPVQVDAAVPVQDIQVTLRPAARITGRIVFDGISPPPAVDELDLIPMEDHPDLSAGTMGTRVGAGAYEHSWARGDCLFAAVIDPRLA